MSAARLADLRELASRVPGAPWLAGGAGASVWLAVAWVDARFLLGVPLAAAVGAGLARWRPRADAPDELVL